MRISPGRAASCSRAARFTASPVANVDSASSTTTSPASIPIRASSWRSSTAARIASAARAARRASSSCAWGTPNAAITASPANFSTMPPCCSTHPETISKKRVTRRRTTSGSAPVTSRVESTMSTNSTDASLRSMTASVETPAGATSIPPCSILRSSRPTTSAGSIRRSWTRTVRTAWAAAYAEHFEPRSVAVGHDMRVSAPAMYQAVDRRNRDAGADVVELGLVGTEMLYHAVSELASTAASASPRRTIPRSTRA